MNAPWRTTLTDLLGVFRQGLVALVPVAEKARMPWRDGEAYDDWDAIAECLYDNLVVRAVVYAREGGREVRLPKYDMVCPSYKGAFIQVEGGSVPEGTTAAFVGFAAVSPDFASVKWVRVLPSGDVPNQKVEYSPCDACKFCLVRGEANERTRIHALTIEV
jgi:hypothetical protein